MMWVHREADRIIATWLINMSWRALRQAEGTTWLAVIEAFNGCWHMGEG